VWHGMGQAGAQGRSHGCPNSLLFASFGFLRCVLRSASCVLPPGSWLLRPGSWLMSCLLRSECSLASLLNSVRFCCVLRLGQLFDL
jgi:hypothetical protein